MSLTGQRIWGGEMELGAGGSSGGRGGGTSREEGWVFLAEGPAKGLGWESLRCVGESGLAMACGVVRPRKGPESCHVIQVCHWS